MLLDFMNMICSQKQIKFIYIHTYIQSTLFLFFIFFLYFKQWKLCYNCQYSTSKSVTKPQSQNCPEAYWETQQHCCLCIISIFIAASFAVLTKIWLCSVFKVWVLKAETMPHHTSHSTPPAEGSRTTTTTMSPINYIINHTRQGL